MTTKELPPQVSAGVLAHMNTDHQHNLLDYARVLAGCDWAESAEMTALDANGFELRVQANGRQETHRVEFPEPVFDGKSLRMMMIALAEQADVPDGLRRVATARVETPNAQRYLKALCNHFDRKATGTYEENKGHVQFPFGDCTLEAEDNALLITVAAESKSMFVRVKDVIGDHLLRFGKKEALEVQWSDE